MASISRRLPAVSPGARTGARRTGVTAALARTVARTIAATTTREKEAPAKKTVKKKIVTTTVTSPAVTSGAKPIVKTARKATSKAAASPKPDNAAVHASVAARKATVARTQVLVAGDTALVADARDAAAIAKLKVSADKATVRTRTTAPDEGGARDLTGAAADVAPKASRPRKPAKTRGPSGVKRSATARLDDPPPAAGAVLLDRVADAIERELTQIEVLVGGHRATKTQRNESERRARTLALLARTLSEVARLRGMNRTRAEHEPASARNLDAFRLDLARRLDSLVSEAKALHPLTSE